MLQCELSKKKRSWLAQFSKPKMLMSDVAELVNDISHNHMTSQEESVPQQNVFFDCGFSCKDLSTLSMFITFNDDCISTGAGTTGATWAGNLGFVIKTQPVVVIVENVPSSRNGANGQQTGHDLRKAGCVVADRFVSSKVCGVPQYRK